MHIGILTGGGDCPGLNGVIRAVTVAGITSHGDRITGLRDGWRGPLEKDTVDLDITAVQDILPVGGTILGTSRTNAGTPERIAAIAKNLSELGIDALIPIGGEDTLGVGAKLAAAGVQCIGVPKTIDNDLSGTDYTFGFDTAVQTASDALDRCRTTAASHHRALVVEVMGRHAGWIALHVGIAADACAVLIPEVPFNLGQIAARVSATAEAGRPPLIVVAEGALPAGGDDGPAVVDEFGHVAVGGIAEQVASGIGQLTGIETRSVVLGHVQRGGTPTAYDRVLSTRFGLAAIEAVHAGRSAEMVALHGTQIELVDLAAATGTLRTVPAERYEEMGVFFGA